MKEENYKLTSHIEELYEKSKDLEDKVFYISLYGNQPYKVTTKTLELACAFAEECESSIYDLWADDDNDIYNNWVGRFEEIKYEDIEVGDEIWDLDDYNFEYCKFPKSFTKTY